LTEQSWRKRSCEKVSRLLEAIVDNATAVIYVKDLEGRYMW